MPTGVPRIAVTLPAKPWWKSRVLWLNAVAAGLFAAEASFSLLQPLLPVNAYGVLAFALIVGNAVLRFLTVNAVQLRVPQ